MAGQQEKQEGITLTQAQQEILTSVLDTVIPPDGDLPGAGEAGVTDYIDDVLTESESLRRLFLNGLADIEIASGESYSAVFESLPGEQKTNALLLVQAEHPAFFQLLVEHAYKGYYSDPDVVRLLGLETRPPQPEGYDLRRFDPATLNTVKDRGQVYREA